MSGYDYAPTDVLLYEAIFRHYRNAVVEHIRTCLTMKHGRKATEALKNALGTKTWDSLVSKAAEAEARGAVVRPREDDFDYLDLGVFTQVLDHHYVDMVPEKWQGQQLASSKRQLTQWMQDVKNARDPAAHPGSRDADVSDAIRAVDSAARTLKRLETRTGSAELNDVLQSLYERAARPNEIGSVAPLDDTLPAAETVVRDFVGRGDELAQLRAWLKHPNKNRWMLVGDGGKGKSAIAYAFAEEVLETAPQFLCGAFWLSAKRRKYSTDRIVDIPNPDFTTLSECLDRILRDYGHETGLGLELAERQEQVLSLLDELPVLLVVDDLDSVDDEQEDVVEFLTLDAARTASKILITSRRKFAGMGATATQVLGLTEEDALEFVQTRWASTGLDADTLSEDDQRAVIAACEGSPLYMGDLLRLAAVALRRGQANIGQVISDWQSRAGTTVRQYALQREMDMLSRTARSVLEALAVAGRPMTTVELSKVAALNELTVSDAAAELHQLYLLSAPSLDEETPRFAIDGNLAVLVRSELQGLPRETQLRNALDAIEGKGKSEAQAAETRDIGRQARLLLNAGRSTEAEQLLIRALERNPEDAYVLALLGFCYVGWSPRRTVDARAQFERASDLGYRDRGMFLAWSRIEGEAGDWTRALKAAERGLAARPKDPMVLAAAARAGVMVAAQLLRAMSESKAQAAFDVADERYDEAIKEAKRLRLRANDISPMFEGWVASAVRQDRDRAVCYRIDQWRKWKANDPKLGHALAQHANDCPTGSHT